MSAIGAITGNGVYAELEHQGKRLKVSQWYLEAMDAVCQTAFLKSAQMLTMMGGTPRAQAEREVALARSFSLGAFGFDAIIEEGGLDNDDELLAVFLHKLLVKCDGTVTYPLALELVKADKNAVLKAVNQANPQNGQKQDKGDSVPQPPPAAQ